MPRYQSRIARTAQDVENAQALRHRAFRGGAGLDQDRFDGICRHVLVERTETGALVGCFRLMTLGSGAEIGASYAAQFYDLSRLAHFSMPMLEMGRFCIDPELTDGADVLRVGWGEVARIVDAENIGMLFGCSSFHGTDAARYLDSFALLRDLHLAPQKWLPKVKAPHVFRFAADHVQTPDRKQALKMMPPLLRSYISMGGWVSDHAVIDHDLDTLHVFTGLDIAEVPPARARLLRSISA